MNTAPEATGLKHPGLVALIDACDILLTGGQKLALIALARCRDTRTGYTTMSLETIGRRSGRVCKRQAGRYIDALVGLGLVDRVGMIGKCLVYKINVKALAEAETCKKLPQQAIAPVDNSTTPDISDTDPGHFEQPPTTFSTQTHDMDVAHSGWFSGYYSGEESDACAPAADLVGTTFPPLPILEDLKTEQPGNLVDDVLAHIADARAEGLPISGQSLRDLIEAADACGEVPLAVAADAVRGCLPAVAVPGAAEPAEPPAELAALATPAAPIVTPPAPVHPTPALAVAIAPDTLAAVNAQRLRHGKAALKHADLQDLHREATLVGIAPQAAAEWILAKPGRNFFRADFVAQAAAPAAAIQPAPIDEAAKAQARAKADQVQAELVRRSIDAMRQGPAASVMLPASAAPITRPAPLRAVTLRHAPPTALGSTGTGWARQAVDGFLAGEPVSHAKLTHAAAALGLAVRDLKAQRAALSGVAA
ncbi:hypothetical protein [Malikia sp.]|uniref:hypothetical protein n=1 Tax=Malikia sp. TaxID=2070706 RepID=UPI002628F8C9|nr:hypothetical protein [Malikia sp.]MDD2728154.1 hypothetical protein [Malikia sp.]